MTICINCISWRKLFNFILSSNISKNKMDYCSYSCKPIFIGFNISNTEDTAIIYISVRMNTTKTNIFGSACMLRSYKVTRERKKKHFEKNKTIEKLFPISFNIMKTNEFRLINWNQNCLYLYVTQE